MDFEFSEEQNILRRSARDFLSKKYSKAKIMELVEDDKGYDLQLWKNMAELGWMGLVFPEKYGGAGATLLDLVILAEEMGRNILPGPFLPTIAFCGLPILQFGSEKQKEKYLPKIASGENIWSLALTESAGSYNESDINLEAVQKDDHYLLRGEKFFVPNANIAKYLLVAARTEKSKKKKDAGITLFIVEADDPAVVIEHITTISVDRQFIIHFSNVRVPKSNILGEVPGNGMSIVKIILQTAAILKCAEMVGACQAVLDISVAYAKERVQFDRPIGSFQAVQHKLADMLISVEGAQYLLYHAAWGVVSGAPSPLQIAAAKIKANEIYETICVNGITTLGAIGFTMDYNLGLYYRNVRASIFAGGDNGWHRDIIANQLGLN